MEIWRDPSNYFEQNWLKIKILRHVNNYVSVVYWPMVRCYKTARYSSKITKFKESGILIPDVFLGKGDIVFT